MARSLNKVMLIGNVGKSPEIKYTPSGIPVAHFKLATSESWRDKDGTFCEHTDWHNIVAWRGLADVVSKIVDKGTRVYIEGKIRTRKFDDKNNVRRFYVEILADNILLLDAKKEFRDNSDYDKKFTYSDDDGFLDDNFEIEDSGKNCSPASERNNVNIDYNDDDLLY
jgi:single-strand DNA-binding protein